MATEMTISRAGVYVRMCVRVRVRVRVHVRVRVWVVGRSVDLWVDLVKYNHSYML